MMFTKYQGQELEDNTINEWTSLNEVYGFKFTSKTDSSKYIFLPAGGWWLDTTHDYAGSRGYYWSAALDHPSGPCNLYFYASNHFFNSNYARRDGLSIRADRPL